MVCIAIVYSERSRHILRSSFIQITASSQTTRFTLPKLKRAIISALVILNLEDVSFTTICEISLNDMNI